MFGSKKLTCDSFSNLIAHGTKINGTVNFTGVLLVKGEVAGDTIQSVNEDSKNEDCIHVAETGVVMSTNMTASNIVIEGRVSCEMIRAEKKIRLSSDSHVIKATILYNEIEIEPGAKLIDCQLKLLD